MDLYKELVHGPGYAVCPIVDMQLFKKLKDSFIEKINIAGDSEKDINVVRKAVVKMSKAEINRSMINMLTFTNLSEMMINSCQNLVESLCGKELFIQRRAFTIFNVPGKEHSKQWPHYELMSGISPLLMFYGRHCMI